MNKRKGRRDTHERRALKPFAFFAVVLVACLALAVPAQAQTQSPDPQALRFDQRLDNQIPLELEFRDENDQPVRLGSYFGDKPVILALGYYACPMLCSLVRERLADSLRALQFDAGREFQVVNVSIDPHETPSAALASKAVVLQQYGRPGAEAGWHMLTGEEAAIKGLADAVGFTYAYDAQLGQYAHPSGIVVLTPQGKVARYFYGIDYPAQDLRLGLVEASAGRIGSPIDQVLLLCYDYNPATGRYTLLITSILRWMMSAAMLVTGLFVARTLIRARKH